MSQLAFAARHSMDSPEWYTPSPFVEAAREVMGAIDLDPMSHEEANATVKAARYFTIEDDCFRHLWPGRVFINPAGGTVPRAWRYLIASFRFAEEEDRVREAIWIGYSLEQLQTLQNACAETPLSFPMCVPKQRIAFVENEAKKAERIAKLKAAGKNPNQKSQPSHANYVTYLGPNSGKFRDVFSRFGQVRL